MSGSFAGFRIDERRLAHSGQVCDIRTIVHPVNTDSSAGSRPDVNTDAGPGTGVASGAIGARSAVSMWTRIERLVADLRRNGVDVSISEVLDVAAGIEHVDLVHRDELRTLLGACLIKHARHLSLFGRTFDRHFPPSRDVSRISDPHADAATPAGDAPTADDLFEQIERSLASGDDVAPEIVASIVDRYAGLDDETRGERYHQRRTLRAIDLTAMLAAAMQRALAAGSVVDRAALDARADRLRDAIVDEIRRRIADVTFDEHPDLVEPPVPDPGDIDLVRATDAELDAVRAAIQPLARRLATRLRRRRRSNAVGRIDVRQTIRRSLGCGGVPIDLSHRRPRRHQPELFVVCDVSGSVAEFSAFTLTLIAALSDEFQRTRSFAFVDALDEITAVLRSTHGVIEPWQLLQSGGVIGETGHSDYGAVLESFWRRHGQELTPRSTVIVVGDARGNRRPARADALGRIAQRAHRLYWLNPEPRHQWDTSDSTQAVYAEHCTAVYETRTLGQLSTAVIDMW
jgi:hypothetical protein